MSNPFIDALQTKDAKTENGMSTHSTSNNRSLDLFFRGGAMRSASEEEIQKVFINAFQEDKLLAMKILFWIRDVRGGAGERKFFRTAMKYLLKVDSSIIQKNYKLIPEFGRWDDLLDLIFDSRIHPELQDELLKYIKTELLVNKNSLLAKWMPRKGKVAVLLRMNLHWTPKFYRKTIVGLTNVVETKMCSNDWENIEYKKVPSLAMTRYRTAFGRHDQERFNEFNQKVIDGEETVNVGAIYPYDVIKQCLLYNTSIDELSITAQWNSLPNYMDGSSNFRILPVCDVSGSMDSIIGNNKNLTAMIICISLGLYISERNIGAFKDYFMTFSSSPLLQKLTGSNIVEKARNLRRANWGMSTDLEATFEEILIKAVQSKVSHNEMPTHILILSDMEFDGCVSNSNATAMEMIKDKYNRYGYELPNVIFWNLQSRNENVPVKSNENGVALVSGFSPSIMTSLLKGNLDPMKVLMDTINVERYSKIKV